MKKASIILIGFLFIISSIPSQAQDQLSDYFAGKWEVLLEDTPAGDATLIMTLERKDGKMEGTLTGTDVEAIEIERIEEKEESLTVYWFSQGYDVNLSLQKKDDDNITGTLMGMFVASGKRINE